MIDVNVSFGIWPFLPNGLDTVGRLLAHLRREGIEEALVAHLGGVLAPDPLEFNLAIGSALARHPRVHAVPVVNPRIAGWRKDLEAWTRAYGAPKAVRILPAFHDYSARGRLASDVAKHAASLGIPLCLQVRLDDERSRYFGLRLRRIRMDDILATAMRVPDCRFVVSNVYLDEARTLLQGASNVAVDTSFVEWLYTVDRLTDGCDVNRILFGSHTPFLETRASVMKVFDGHQAVVLRRRIGYTNARRLFGLT